MAEKTDKVTSLSISIVSSTQPALGSPVKLKTDKPYSGEICSGANDISIGCIENVERSNTGLDPETTWICRVPVSGPVQEVTVNGSVTIGNRLVLHSSGTKFQAQATSLSGANHKFSPWIALDSNASGDGKIIALGQPAYIPTA